MRSLTIVGLILTAISGFMFYFTTDFLISNLQSSHYMGMMGGIGIGLIIGGIVGYISKGSAIKEAQRRKEIKELEEQKMLLEKRNAELAALNKNAEPTQFGKTNSGGSFMRL